MRDAHANLPPASTVYVGVDLHRRRWHVTARTADSELFSASIEGTWEALRRVLDRYRGRHVEVAYEAGYFGYRLHDRLAEYGAACTVTPPSPIPQEAGDRVKTDRLDSRKLARLLAKGMLKRVWAPSPQGREHRRVIRRRRQLIRDRARTQDRVKSELRFYGVEPPEPAGPWTKTYVENLRRVRLPSRWMQESFQRLLEQYDFLSEQIGRQARLLRELAQAGLYRERVRILCSVPGVGLIAAMEQQLLELQDVARFRRADELAAYVGLTPSQHTSADKVRMGRITKVGKGSLRAMPAEASWLLIRKEAAMKQTYEGIRLRPGGKRAIVAVARRLLLRARRMLLDGREYAAGSAG
jgi:transposase